MAKSLLECAIETVLKEVPPELVKECLTISLQELLIERAALRGKDIFPLLHDKIRKLIINEKQCTVQDADCGEWFSTQMRGTSTFNSFFFETIWKCTKITHLELSTLVVSQGLFSALSCFNCLNTVLLTLYKLDNDQFFWKIFCSLSTSTHTLGRLALQVYEHPFPANQEEEHLVYIEKWDDAAINSFPALTYLELENFVIEDELVAPFLRQFDALQVLKLELRVSIKSGPSPLNNMLACINQQHQHLKKLCLIIRPTFYGHGELNIVIPKFSIIENIDLRFIDELNVHMSVPFNCPKLTGFSLRIPEGRLKSLHFVACQHLRYLCIKYHQNFNNFIVPATIQTLSLYGIELLNIGEQEDFASNLAELRMLCTLEITIDLAELFTLDPEDVDTIITNMNRLLEVIEQRGVKFLLNCKIKDEEGIVLHDRKMIVDNSLYNICIEGFLAALCTISTQHLKEAALLFQAKINQTQDSLTFGNVEKLKWYGELADEPCKSELLNIIEKMPKLKEFTIILMIGHIENVLPDITEIAELISKKFENKIIARLVICFTKSAIEVIMDNQTVFYKLALPFESVDLHFNGKLALDLKEMKSSLQDLFDNICSSSACTRINITTCPDFIENLIVE